MPKLSPAMKSSTETKPPRRTQGERSDAMRKRLLAATLQSLSEDGYAGSTLSSIVRRAGVSRGAQVHHYPNKQALMMDAAEDLLRRTYRRLGQLLLSISEEEDRLQALVEATWTQMFATPLYRAYCELVAASQRDPALAVALRQMLLRVTQTFEPATSHYFETTGTRLGPGDVFLQLSCLLSGLALQAPLLNNEAVVRSQLELWVHQVSPFMHARKGITSPPPRPAVWSRPLEVESTAHAPRSGIRAKKPRG